MNNHPNATIRYPSLLFMDAELLNLYNQEMAPNPTVISPEYKKAFASKNPSAYPKGIHKNINRPMIMQSTPRTFEMGWILIMDYLNIDSTLAMDSGMANTITLSPLFKTKSPSGIIG